MVRSYVYINLFRRRCRGIPYSFVFVSLHIWFAYFYTASQVVHEYIPWNSPEDIPSKSVYQTLMNKNKNKNKTNKLSYESGAIIGDADRKRAPILVLGLSPWYGTIILFLEQIAPSPTTRAYMLRGFLRMSRGGNGVRNSRSFSCFWPATQRVYVRWNFAWVFSS